MATQYLHMLPEVHFLQTVVDHIHVLSVTYASFPADDRCF